MTPEGRGYAASAARFVTAEQLAGHLGVSRQWVYEHKLELGYVPLGSGPKARLRFDLLSAERAFEGRLRRDEPRQRRRQRPRRAQVVATSYRILPKSSL